MENETIWIIVIVVLGLIVVSDLFGHGPFGIFYSVGASLLNLIISALIIVALVLVIIWLYQKVQANPKRRR